MCKGSFNTAFDWVRRRPDNEFIYNTYFFRGNHYWMYENHANRTRYGDPLYIAREWDGVPDNVDGYVHILFFNGAEVIDNAYFFKGMFSFSLFINKLYISQDIIISLFIFLGDNIEWIMGLQPCYPE